MTEARDPLAWDAAFFAHLPGGRRLVAAIDDLARAGDAQASHEALTRLFVDLLGFAPSGLDETLRLGDQATIRRLRRVATYGAFVVTLAEMPGAWPYPNTLAPVFRLHPFGLVIGATPGFSTCRVYFRESGPNAHAGLSMRTLVGSRAGRDVGDTLTIWAQRFAALRPRFGDVPTTLAERAGDALGASPEEICRRSTSISVDAAAAPPGPTWREALGTAVADFVQVDTRGDRLFLGLERVLRDAFPMTVGAHGLLHYRRYVADTPPDALLTSWRAGRTALYPLRLELELRPAAPGPAVSISVAAGVPSFDDQGRCVLSGGYWQLRPRVLQDGRVVLAGAPMGGARRPKADLMEGALPELLDPDPDEPEEFEIAETEPMGDSEPGLDDLGAGPDGLVALPGAHLSTLLTFSASRLLGALARRLFRLQPELDPVAEIRGAFRSMRGGESCVVLTAKRWLRAFLVPQAHGASDGPDLPVLVSAADDGAVLPPGWACLDVSADLPVGCWYPVAGARLDPAGQWVLPARDPEGDVRLARAELPATRLNPRRGGTGPGPRSSWIAESLASASALPAGTIQGAATFAGSASPVAVETIHRSGPTLRLRLRPGTPMGRRVIHRVQADVSPSYGGPLCDVPEPRVQVGEWLATGDIWLRWFEDGAPRNGQHPGHGPVGRFANAIMCRFCDPCTVWRVPPGLSGRVVGVEVQRRTDRFGALDGWRATLEIRAPRASSGHALLPDGRLAPVSLDLTLADAPFAESGQPAHAVLEDPEFAPVGEGERFVDPVTELPIEVFRLAPGSLLLTASEPEHVIGPDRHLTFKLRDGEGVALGPRAPALSAAERLWWQSRDPQAASASAAIECAWSSGVPPAWLRLLAVLSVSGLPRPAWEAVESPAPDDPVEADDELAVDREDEATEEPDGDDAAEGDDEAGVLPDPSAVESPRPLSAAEEKPGTPTEPTTAWPRSSAARLRTLDPFEGTGFDGPTEARCRCGELRGITRLHELCGCCRTRVRPWPKALGERPRIRLPEPILHPWHRAGVAAALGLTSQELREQAIERGTATLRADFDRVTSEDQPMGEAAVRRLRTLETGSARRALTRGLLQLQSVGHSRLRDAGFIHELLVLPSYLHPTGRPTGASMLVGSPLTDRYLLVRNAAERLARISPHDGTLPDLVCLARRRLFEAVDALFGDVEQAPDVGEPDDLARLLARIWPLTRPRSLRSVVPGLVTVFGALAAGGAAARIPRLELPLERGREVGPAPAPEPPAAPPLAPPPAPPPAPGPSGPQTVLFSTLIGDTGPIAEISAGFTHGLVWALRQLGVRTVGELAALPANKVRHSRGIGPKKFDTILTALTERASRVETRAAQPAVGPPPPAVRAPPPSLARLRRLRTPAPTAPPDPDACLISQIRPGQRTLALRTASLIVCPGLDESFVPKDEASWSERAARHRLGVWHWPRVVALLLDLEPWALAGLAGSLESASAHPSRLVALLERTTPVRLPRSTDEAERLLGAVLVAAFPGDGAAAGRTALLEVLWGFWLGPPSDETPLGWRRLAGGATLPPPFTRAVPPFHSDAWSLLDGHDAAMAPVRWFLRKGSSDVRRWPITLQLATGWPVNLDAPAGRPAFAPTETASAPTASPEVVPSGDSLEHAVAEASVSDEESVVFLDVSLSRWLHDGWPE